MFLFYKYVYYIPTNNSNPLNAFLNTDNSTAVFFLRYYNIINSSTVANATRRMRYPSFKIKLVNGRKTLFLISGGRSLLTKKFPKTYHISLIR